MTPTLRRLVREMLKESDERHIRLRDLDDEINNLIAQEDKIWREIDAVENPGTNLDDYNRLIQLHVEKGYIEAHRLVLIDRKNTIKAELGHYIPGRRQ